MPEERLCITLPAFLAERLDEVSKFFDFESRERFAEAAVRRLTDEYIILMGRMLRED